MRWLENGLFYSIIIQDEEFWKDPDCCFCRLPTRHTRGRASQLAEEIWQDKVHTSNHSLMSSSGDTLLAQAGMPTDFLQINVLVLH